MQRPLSKGAAGEAPGTVWQLQASHAHLGPGKDLQCHHGTANTGATGELLLTVSQCELPTAENEALFCVVVTAYDLKLHCNIKLCLHISSYPWCPDILSLQDRVETAFLTEGVGAWEGWILDETLQGPLEGFASRAA